MNSLKDSYRSFISFLIDQKQKETRAYEEFYTAIPATINLVNKLILNKSEKRQFDNANIVVMFHCSCQPLTLLCYQHDVTTAVLFY